MMQALTFKFYLCFKYQITLMCKNDLILHGV